MVGTLGGLFNNTLQQIVEYNLVGQLVSAILSPYYQALSNEVNSVTPLVPLSPADLALAVIRNIQDEGSAAGEASQSGVSADRFHRLVLLTGDAPGPQELAEALRRGFIDAGRYDVGIRQGRLRDEWGPLMQQLAIREPSPTEALTAAVEGQISDTDARAKFAAFGGDPKNYDWLLGTIGAGPSPLEAATMAYRGVIPWDGSGLGVMSFEQAVKEGHSRNKWIPAWRALSVYLPPPRTIVAMVKEGALTHDEAATLLAKHGLSADLIAAYLKSATGQQLAHHKLLAESQVKALYEDQLIAKDAAVAMLVGLGYTAGDAGYVIALADAAVAHKFLTAAVGHVHTLYVHHKLDRSAAQSALSDLKVPPDGMSSLLDLWDHERAANVRTLTAAEIVDAWHVKIIDQPTAVAELVAIGFSAFDAWVLLSIKNKGPLGNQPGGKVA